MFNIKMNIADYDSELYEALADESQRQEDHIELIASENYTSPRVMEAQGSMLTNKYAEGYPSKRYYGGCEYVDVAEDLAIARLKELYENNRLIIAGPNPAIDSLEPGDAGFSGSLIVADFPSLEAAKEWANADPYLDAGVYKEVHVKPFKQVLPPTEEE